MRKTLSKISKGWRTMPILADILAQNRQRIFFGTLLMLLSRAAGLIFPVSTKFFGDEILVKHNYEYLSRIALVIGVSTIVDTAARFGVSQILGKAAQQAVAEMRKRLQRKMLELRVSFYSSMPGGQLMSRVMNDADSIRILVGTGLGTILGSFLTMLIAVGVLFYLNWLLTLVTFLVLLIFGLSVYVSLKKMRPMFRERSKLLGKVFGHLGETINGIRIVKSYVSEVREESKFADGIDQITRNGFKSLTGTSEISALSSLTTGIIAILIITIGGGAVQNGSMSIGDFLMYVSFTFLLGAPVAELSSLGTQIVDSLATLERVREILDAKSENEYDEQKASLTKIDGNFDFVDVYCRYENDVRVLQGVSFHAAAGTTTALVGPSGAGKSTILNLLLNFMKPDRGTISVDGVNIQTLKLADYRKHFGVVLQDNFLFDGTITENVRFSKPHAGAAEIREVCRIANADEFIERFPDQYETIIGERGVKLSGGQRQRLAIARAILANPRILILDEATSSLDSESEALIQEALYRLRENRTTFIIAHRLSTVRSADQILVLETGKIIETGNHSALIELDGKYKQLYDRQFRLETNIYESPSQ